MEKTQVAITASVPVGTIVFIVLLVLKVTGNVSMSWFAVLTSFIWAPIIAFVAILGIILFVFAIIAIVAGIATLIDSIR